MIIELINNIAGPLRLPEWTPTLVILLLAIGFPIIFIFSWIYDVHPEGGVVKTLSADKVKSEDMPKSSNSWKIASYISFVMIIVLIVLNIVHAQVRKRYLRNPLWCFHSGMTALTKRMCNSLTAPWMPFWTTCVKLWI